MQHSPVPRPSMSPAGRLFTVIALIEAMTWAGLLIGMFLKYVSNSRAKE